MKNKHGFMIIAAVIIMIVLGALGLFGVSMLSTDTSIAVDTLKSTRAFYVAEAGLEHVIYKLKNDSGYRVSPTVVAGSLSGGTFSVAVSSVGYVYTLTSTATVDSVTRVTKRIVTLVPDTGPGSYPGGVPEAFQYTMHAFGNHVKFQDSLLTINGDVAATNQLQDVDDPTINGTKTEHSPVSAPFSIDMAGYRSIANYIQAGGFSFTSGSTYGAPGSEQIWYIQGNVTIPNNVTIYGSVISEGNIFMNSSGIVVDSASGYPALIAAGTNIHANGLTNSTISGLIASENNVDFDSLNNVTINGTILSDNNTFLRYGSANSTINYDSDIMLHPPPFFPGYSPSYTVTPGAWDEIY